MKTTRHITFFLLFIFFSLKVSAHDTWLLAGKSRAEAGEKIELSLTSGMDFPKSETAIKPERIAVAACRVAGQTLNLGSRQLGKDALQVSLNLPNKEGLATVWIKLKPRPIELTPDKVEEYLQEIDAPKEIRETWQQGSKRWREVYTKHAKTFILVGKSDDSWSSPVGLGLEIVPEKDPTKLHSGDTLPVRVLKKGKPFANFSISFVNSLGKQVDQKHTDKDGRVEFSVNQAGRWLMRGTDLRKSSKPRVDWESDFTTLTFETN
ncbi:MAG: DUF4198 domain-containing protein [Blastocatellia bacterium]|nr:DUF4198 domain-containing protein [Blastocatellia bacterium]